MEQQSIQQNNKALHAAFHVRVEEEAGVGEALDDGGGAREEGLELVAVQYDGQAAGGAAGEQHLLCGGHPDGEEVPDGGVPDALPAEVKPVLLQYIYLYYMRPTDRCLTKSPNQLLPQLIS